MSVCHLHLASKGVYLEHVTKLSDVRIPTCLKWSIYAIYSTCYNMLVGSKEQTLSCLNVKL